MVEDPDFTYKLYLGTLVPLALVLLSFIGRSLTRLMGFKGYFNGKYLLICFYFILPVTSTIVLKSFPCNMFDNGNGEMEGFMMVDMTLECQGAKREW